MSEMHTSLLPNGLKDLLPPEAEKEALIIHSLMQAFSKFGYQRVKPPLVEFEESLLSGGVGQTLARHTFRLMDPVSRRMMGVRADTTAQIERIVKTRMSDVPRPLRLCYAADILKVNGSQLRPERQFCQVGYEMIGVQSTQDDVEICLNALSAAHEIGIGNLSIDLSMPVLVNQLFEAFKVGEGEQASLNKLLQKWDRDGLSSIDSEVADCLVLLLDASGVASKAVENLTNVTLPEKCQDSFAKLKDFYKELSLALDVYGLDDVNLTMDFIERRGFEYKSGVSFTLFSSEVTGELGRGGRYRISEAEEAAGCSLYMDSLLKVASIQLERNEKSVALDASWQEIKELQDAGYQVSRVNK